MATLWEPDQSVIGYLERRVKYYKAKQRSGRRMHLNDFIIKRWGKKKVIEAQKRLEIHYNKRISEYSRAIGLIKDMPDARRMN